jgi:FkbM family methyltransferase
MPNALKRSVALFGRAMGYEIKRWRHPSREQLERDDPLLNIRAFFQRHAVTPQLVLDVGANRGTYGDQCLELFPAARVICFEPTPDLHAALAARYEGNPRARVLPVAVTETDGPLTFHVRSDDVWNSILANGDSGITPGGARQVAVEGVKLDTLAARESLGQIDLLKLDIQGAELMALRGARELLAGGRIGIVQTEINFQRLYAGQADLEGVSRLMHGHGYWLQGIYQGSTLNGMLSSADLVFAHARFL